MSPHRNGHKSHQQIHQQRLDRNPPKNTPKHTPINPPKYLQTTINKSINKSTNKSAQRSAKKTPKSHVKIHHLETIQKCVAGLHTKRFYRFRCVFGTCLTDLSSPRLKAGPVSHHTFFLQFAYPLFTVFVQRFLIYRFHVDGAGLKTIKKLSKMLPGENCKKTPQQFSLNTKHVCRHCHGVAGTAGWPAAGGRDFCCFQSAPIGPRTDREGHGRVLCSV